jgi:hypothetical protein
MTPVKGFSPCHILLAIQDVSGDLFNHLRDGTRPDEDQMGTWMDKLAWASSVVDGLIITGEDIVEDGPRDDRLEALKRALALAQGLQEYRRRAHRR